MGSLSVIIATRNRAAALRETLRAVPPGAEVLVVDNASTDLTSAAVRDARPEARLIRLDRNEGPTAKQIALEQVSNEFVVALDDDCAPTDHATWAAMLSRLRRDDSLACAGFGVRLPSRRWECAALPRVFVGAAVAFRRNALLEAGGYDRRLFMQAEEYDIVYRLAARGWRCEVFHDLVALHRKHEQGRRNARTVFLDARNNVAQALRYLPTEWRSRYAKAWTERYVALGRAGRHATAAKRGVAAARLDPRMRGRREMPMGAFEDVFRLREIAPALRALQVSGVERVLFATLGKNMPMYAEAARWAGLRVAAVADDRFARAGVRWCEGAPVLTTEQALHEDFDAVVVSDSAPIFAHQAAERWRRLTVKHVLAPDGLDPESARDAAEAGSARTAAA
ncbi:MAG: glycosyltransferase family 2 protein [Phycisphaerales bacterium]